MNADELREKAREWCDERDIDPYLRWGDVDQPPIRQMFELLADFCADQLRERDKQDAILAERMETWAKVVAAAEAREKERSAEALRLKAALREVVAHVKTANSQAAYGSEMDIAIQVAIECGESALAEARRDSRVNGGK